MVALLSYGQSDALYRRLTFTLLAMLLLLPLVSMPVAQFKEQLEELRQLAAPTRASRLVAQLIIEQLDSYPLSWQYLPDEGASKLDLLPSLRVYFPGTKPEKNLIFATSLSGASSDLITLIQLIELWQQQAPTHNISIVFLGQEKIKQVKRTNFLQSPFQEYKIRPFNASHSLTANYLAQQAAGLIYLEQQETARLLIDKQTQSWWLEALWQQLAPLNLALKGGLGLLSKDGEQEELFSIYNQRDISVVFASLSNNAMINSKLLQKLAYTKLPPASDDFFYAFAFNGQLYSISAPLILALLFFLLSIWALLFLLHHHHIPMLAWLQFILVVLLAAASLYLSDMLLGQFFTAASTQMASSIQNTVLLLKIWLSLLFFHLTLLFGLIKWLPKSQYCLRQAELSNVVIIAYFAIQSPILGLAYTPLLLSLNGISLSRSRKLRYCLLLLHVFLYLPLFFLLSHSGMRMNLISSNFGSQFNIALLLLPVFLLILSYQQKFRQLSKRLLLGQLWFIIALLAPISLGSYLKIMRDYRFQPQLIEVNYIMDFGLNKETDAMVLVKGSQSFFKTVLYLGKRQFQLEGEPQLSAQLATSLSPPTNKISMQRFYRRQRYRISINYPLEFRNVQVFIDQPSNKILNSNYPVIPHDNGSIISINNTATFPIILEFSSSAKEPPSMLSFAANLKDIPIITTVAAQQPTKIRKSCQLYWQVALK